MGLNPMSTVDLNGLDLSGRDFSGYNFSLISAMHTNFSRCDLKNSDFSSALLENANFSGADISECNFSESKGSDANFTNTIGLGVDFYRTDLQGAVLANSDFRKAMFAMTCLVDTCLDGADISDAVLWESQRVSWSIKGIRCSRCYWSENKEAPFNKYVEGEFEKLHAYYPSVKLHFQDGVTPLEVYSVDHMLVLIQKHFNGSRASLTSYYRAGQGAEIEIKIDPSEKDKLSDVTAAVEAIPEALELVREQISNGLSQIESRFEQLLSTPEVSEPLKQVIIQQIETQNIIEGGSNNQLLIGKGNPNDDELTVLLDKLTELVSELKRLREKGELDNDLFGAEELSTDILEQLKASDGKAIDVELGQKAATLRQILMGAAGSGAWELLIGLLAMLR